MEARPSRGPTARIWRRRWRGRARGLLKIFAGARMMRMIGLARVSEPIAVPRSEQRLVSHHCARGEPAIRAAFDAIGSHLERRD